MKSFTGEAQVGGGLERMGEEYYTVVGHRNRSSIIITAVKSWSGNIKASRIQTNPKCGCGNSPITLKIVVLEERAWINSLFSPSIFFLASNSGQTKQFQEGLQSWAVVITPYLRLFINLYLCMSGCRENVHTTWTNFPGAPSHPEWQSRNPSSLHQWNIILSKFYSCRSPNTKPWKKGVPSWASCISCFTGQEN